MGTASGCRPCVQCENYTHHWMEDLAEDIYEPRQTHVCKHCPAIGEYCLECHGDGCAVGHFDMDDPPLCKKCDGEGVIEIVRGQG